MFWSIGKSWEAVTSLNPDFRELIPEFFTLPQFLMNTDKFDLGFHEEANTRVNDVVLPPWAKNAYEFINLNRQALESEYVSRNLHKWIDLIFGYKQQGPEAIKARNTFHAYCYQSCITKEVLTDPEMLLTIQSQAGNVGIIPRQLFTSPHPAKTSVIDVPRFSCAKIDFLFKLKGMPIHTFMVKDKLYFLDNECMLRSISLEKGAVMGEDMPTGSLSKFLILGRNMSAPYKSFAYIPGLSRLVTSSLYDNTFNVFRLTSDTIIHMLSLRQKFSLLSTLNYAGGPYLLTSWRDSSLTLWDLSSNNLEPVYRATPHASSLVDVEVSEKLTMIASLDKENNCILSMLMTGKFVRSFSINSPDPIQMILLFSSGFIGALAIAELPRRESSIYCYGIDGEKMSDVHFDQRVKMWQKVEFACSLCGVAVAFEDGRFIFVTIPELKILVDITTSHIVRFIMFVKEHNTFLLVAEDKNVYAINLQQ